MSVPHGLMLSVVLAGAWLGAAAPEAALAATTPAVNASGLDGYWEIDDASRKNFFRYLASASKEFRPEERGEIVAHFQPWADRVDGHKSLKIFAEGGSITLPVSLSQRGKNLIRPFVQRLYGRFR